MDEAQLSPAHTNGSNGTGPQQPRKKVMKVKVPTWCGKWAVGMNDYKDGVVGAKSKNIAGRRPLRAAYANSSLCLTETIRGRASV